MGSMTDSFLNISKLTQVIEDTIQKERPTSSLILKKKLLN